jgi:hypothetical protein
MAEKAVRMSAPVSLNDCKVAFMDDGSAYLVDKASEERICRAYGYDDAPATWRSMSTFWKKEDEEGFWVSFDDRKVVRTLD